MPASPAPDGPLDDDDRVVLDAVAAAWTRADPPPSGLDALVDFALALDATDFELALPAGDRLAGSGARAAGEPRTLTFDCAVLTIMVTVVPRPDGRWQLDGWLAPAAALTVEIRTGDGPPVTVRADDTGRFVADAVPAGLTQLTVRLQDPSLTVVTPAVVL